jgi:hypothetical protein
MDNNKSDFEAGDLVLLKGYYEAADGKNPAQYVAFHGIVIKNAGFDRGERQVIVDFYWYDRAAAMANGDGDDDIQWMKDQPAKINTTFVEILSKAKRQC